MRLILIDWLVDVHLHFGVASDTLSMAIALIDKYLAGNHGSIIKSDLQLVGVACMKIADVFLERSKEYYRQENSQEYAFITADEFTKEQVVAMEKKVLTFVDFELQFPTPVSMFKLMLGALLTNENEATVKAFSMAGSYLCYLSLLDITL